MHYARAVDDVCFQKLSVLSYELTLQRALVEV
jgi:hypothetical protein